MGEGAYVLASCAVGDAVDCTWRQGELSRRRWGGGPNLPVCPVNFVTRRLGKVIACLEEWRW